MTNPFLAFGLITVALAIVSFYTSFGVIGSNVPCLIRALVACGWFGIQTMFGARVEVGQRDFFQRDQRFAADLGIDALQVQRAPAQEVT